MPELALHLQTKTFHITHLAEVTSELIAAFDGFTCVLLEGEMGAGKTTLAKEIGRQLGVNETMASPTFSILNEYETEQGDSIYHFDFYRIQNETEAVDMGVEEYVDSGNLCLIEWPEKIPNLLPPIYFKIQLRQIDAQTREIRYGKHRKKAYWV
ncbi:MAG: tRNA (adenosine(37)-N6)-threonylcarbamoyltransferase complex ATPase subunit type 1 TsaE [Cytophagales bacterium]